MRIALLTPPSANRTNERLRRTRYLSRALQRAFSVEHVIVPQRRQQLGVRLSKWIVKVTGGGKYDPNRSPAVLRRVARRVAAQLDGREVDVVVSPGTGPVVYLDVDIPIVIWWDAVFNGWLKMNEGVIHYSKKTIREGHRMEKMALGKCRLAVFSNDWARNDAISTYGFDNCRAFTIPFGPNLDVTHTRQQVDEWIRGRALEEINLLFIGSNWRHKGGDLALQVVARLNASGRATRLTVVGSMPDLSESDRTNVRALGFVDTTTDEGARRLREELSRAHFLLLPTRRDCAPTVINEANAFGVPALVTDVGGVSSLISDHVNGALFDAAAGVDEWASFVERLALRPGEYRALAASAFMEYERNLSWPVAAGRFHTLLREELSGCCSRKSNREADRACVAP
jgi:glycosyltransferase involved in cell wall biosynthesis